MQRLYEHTYNTPGIHETYSDAHHTLAYVEHTRKYFKNTPKHMNATSNTPKVRKYIRQPVPEVRKCVTKYVRK